MKLCDECSKKFLVNGCWERANIKSECFQCGVKPKSLRDEIAIEVMKIDMSSERLLAEDIAQRAYELADAMMARRQKLISVYKPTNQGSSLSHETQTKTLTQ